MRTDLLLKVMSLITKFFCSFVKLLQTIHNKHDRGVLFSQPRVNQVNSTWQGFTRQLQVFPALVSVTYFSARVVLRLTSIVCLLSLGIDCLLSCYLALIIHFDWPGVNSMVVKFVILHCTALLKRKILSVISRVQTSPMGEV